MRAAPAPQPRFFPAGRTLSTLPPRHPAIPVAK